MKLTELKRGYDFLLVRKEELEKFSQGWNVCVREIHRIEAILFPTDDEDVMIPLDIEERMSLDDFEEIFDCAENMAGIREELALGYYSDVFQVACDRMLESALDARGLALNEELLTGESVIEYIMAMRSNGCRYTLELWVKDTKDMYPESFMQDQKSDEEEKFMGVDDFIKMFEEELLLMRKLQKEYWRDTEEAKDGTVDLEMSFQEWSREYVGCDLMRGTSSVQIPRIRKEIRDAIASYMKDLQDWYDREESKA